MTELEKDALTVLMHGWAMPAEQRRPALALEAQHRVRVPLAVLETHLQRQLDRGWPHLAAERFTVADVCVASVVNWLRHHRALMAEFPTVAAWVRRCVARPAYQALKAAT